MCVCVTVVNEYEVGEVRKDTDRQRERERERERERKREREREERERERASTLGMQLFIFNPDVKTTIIVISIYIALGSYQVEVDSDR